VDAAAIERLICEHLQEILKIGAHDADPLVNFDDLGLDSAAAIGLVGELEDQLNLELDPTLAYDFPNARSLALAVAGMGRR
jgi:acyl carrier protein